MSENRDDEHDPTGIRNLLSGMSDPQPMSDDLVRRIAADIEKERATRDDPWQRFDPAFSRPSNTRRHVLAGVALLSAAATVVGVVAMAGLGGLLHQGPDATTAALTGLSTPRAGGATPADNATTSHAQAPADIRLVTSGTDYHSGRLDEQVRRLLADSPATVGSVGSATVDACLRALSLDGQDVLVDAATYDGSPALVVLGPPVHGPAHDLRTVAVMPTTCDRSDTAPLAGPYRFR